MDFDLHPRLAATGLVIAELALCRVILKDDSRWPWLILVPRRAELCELHQLSGTDAAVLMDEIRRASAALAKIENVSKVNVGALGNEVAQLHVHVVGRWPGDPAWPAPVWGVAGKVAYTPEELQRLSEAVRAALAA